jgi:hypothetical protein
MEEKDIFHHASSRTLASAIGILQKAHLAGHNLENGIQGTATIRDEKEGGDRAESWPHLAATSFKHLRSNLNGSRDNRRALVFVRLRSTGE